MEYDEYSLLFMIGMRYEYISKKIKGETVLTYIIGGWH